MIAVALSLAITWSNERAVLARPETKPTIKPTPSSSSPLPSRPAEYLGVILPRHSANIAPRFEGKVIDVLVRLGDHVAAGAVIATLGVPTLGYDLEVAQANLKATDVDQARAKIELSEAEERLARRKALAAEA